MQDRDNPVNRELDANLLCVDDMEFSKISGRLGHITICSALSNIHCGANKLYIEVQPPYNVVLYNTVSYTTRQMKYK